MTTLDNTVRAPDSAIALLQELTQRRERSLAEYAQHAPKSALVEAVRFYAEA